MIPRRTVLAGLAPLLLGAARAAATNTAPPGRAIYMLVASPAGTTADRIAHHFAAALSRHLEALKAPITEVDVVNRPGDAGRLMLSALGDAPPTGTAIGWVSTPNLVARMIDRSDPSLLQRLRLVGQIQREPVAFVSLATDPADGVQDIIRRAGEDADAVPMATPPAGSPPHLAVLRLQAVAQTRLNIVTFPSGAAARQALIAGNVSAAALGLSEVIEAILDGTLSALGIASHRRFGLLPDTPVLDEAGIPLKAFIRRGVAVPAGAPADVVDTLAQAMKAMGEDDDFRDEAEKSGCYVAWADGGAWMQQLQVEHEELTKLWQTDPWISSSGG